MKKLMMISILSVLPSIASISFANQINSYHFPISNHHSTSHKVSTTKPIIDLGDLLHNKYVFALRDPETGNLSYTLSGQFVMKNDFFYQNGSRLQGYILSTELVNNSCVLSDIKVLSTIYPQATTQYNVRLNLDSNSAKINQPFNPNNDSSFNYVSSASIFDGLGEDHLLSLFFVKSEANYWSVYVAVDDTVITQGHIKFNTSGNLVQTEGLSNIVFNPSNRASPQVLSISLAGSTQYGNAFSIVSIEHDGHSLGGLNNVDVDEIGYVNAYYTNGESITAGKIAVLPNIN